MTGEDKTPDLERSAPDAAPPPPRKKSSVITYLAVLFAAAFLLLLLAYFMQQRTSEQAIGSLKESITSIESLDDLIEENRVLRESLEEAQARLTRLEAELAQAGDQLEALSGQWEALALTTSALSALYSAESSYLDRDYSGAAAALTAWNRAQLEELIDGYDADSQPQALAPEGFLLRPRYDALVAALIDRDALDEEAWAENGSQISLGLAS